MADVFDSWKRSEVMSRIRSRDTSPEKFVRSLLFRAGFRYRLCSNKLPGHPDVVLAKWRVVVFVNGCFWHVHEGCPRAVEPKTNVEFWRNKLRNNKRRDNENYERLKSLGWRVLVVWECACRKTLTEELSTRLETFIRSSVEIPFLEIGGDTLKVSSVTKIKRNLQVDP